MYCSNFPKNSNVLCFFRIFYVYTFFFFFLHLGIYIFFTPIFFSTLSYIFFIKKNQCLVVLSSSGVFPEPWLGRPRPVIGRQRRWERQRVQWRGVEGKRQWPDSVCIQRGRGVECILLIFIYFVKLGLHILTLYKQYSQKII